MSKSKEITMTLANVANSLAKEAFDEWDELGND